MVNLMSYIGINRGGRHKEHFWKTRELSEMVCERKAK